jgi:hypothetical protein
MSSRDAVLRELIRWETGELDDAEMLEAFAGGIATGDVWRLQGYFGRHAASLIDQGLISQKGRINWHVVHQVAGAGP